MLIFFGLQSSVIHVASSFFSSSELLSSFACFRFRCWEVFHLLLWYWFIVVVFLFPRLRRSVFLLLLGGIQCCWFCLWSHLCFFCGYGQVFVLLYLNFICFFLCVLGVVSLCFLWFPVGCSQHNMRFSVLFTPQPKSGSKDIVIACRAGGYGGSFVS